MEDENIFIDSLVKKKVKNYTENPYSSWEEMQILMEQNGIESNSYKGLKNIAHLKTEIAIVSGAIILATGIYLFKNVNHTEPVQKQDLKYEMINTEPNRNKNDIPIINRSENKKDTTFKKIEESKPEKNTENKTVKLKIEVPVHKHIIIKKQIFIKDTVLNN